MTDREKSERQKPARKPPERAAPEGAHSRAEEGSLETRLWLRLLGCYNVMEGELRSRLREEFGSTLPRFDVLTQVARPPVGPTMGELSERLMVTNANMTNVTSRLEGEGLVERKRDAVDARVQRVYLTTEGRRAVRDMIPAHRRWLADLMRHVDTNDLKALDELLARFRSGLRDATRRS